MTATVGGDGERLVGLFAEDGQTYDGNDPASMAALHDWYRAVGWEFSSEGCEYISTGAVGSMVDCGYAFESDLTRAAGLGPISGVFRILVQPDGEIDAVVDQFDYDSNGPAWEAFLSWVSERHPNDLASMYEPDFGWPRTDPTSIQLWDRYLDEFAAEVSG